MSWLRLDTSLEAGVIASHSALSERAIVQGVLEATLKEIGWGFVAEMV